MFNYRKIGQVIAIVAVVAFFGLVISSAMINGKESESYRVLNAATLNIGTLDKGETLDHVCEEGDYMIYFYSESPTAITLMDGNLNDVISKNVIDVTPNHPIELPVGCLKVRITGNSSNYTLDVYAPPGAK